MKVEIDADDLCWLKKRNKHLEADIANLHRQLYAAHACNVDYQVECDWEKLKEERDWWRDKAYKRDYILSGIKSYADKLTFGQLYCEAEELGYE